MARSTLLARANIGPGTIVSPSVQVLAGRARLVRVILDPQPWNDPTDLVLFGIERSADGGGTWRHFVSGNTIGGARDKLGNMPSVTVEMDVGESFLARGFITLSRRMNIGIFGDVE